MMTSTQAISTAAATTSAPGSMLRWTFQREGREVTCEVRVGDKGNRCGVHITADWDRERPIIEAVPTAVAAVRRHAEIAMMFREAGWSTARRSA
jgi:hypothetical protein